MHIEVTTSPTQDDEKTIKQGIVDFNRQSIPDIEPNEDEINFSVFARNESKNVIGGIRATCYWNTLHIELLWLSDECRGQGTGKNLIEAAESFAKSNGCEKAFVETTSWQAKPFYEKVGYEHIATLPDRPKGHASYYLTKTLA